MLNLDILVGSFTAIVGESGCGKSTVASILMGRNRGYRGTVTVGDQELSHIREDHLLEHVTYVGHQSYLFQGTVRENLRMGCPTADETQMWAVLERVKLADFLRGEKGLDTPLLERAANLSGGSANGWRWRGRCSITVRCIFSTKPPPTSTWRVRMPSWRRYRLWLRPKRCS